MNDFPLAAETFGLRTLGVPDLVAVLNYRFPPLIQRLQRKEGLTEAEAEEVFLDTLKFLFMCATSRTPLEPSPRIDAAWHHFILFTHAYSEFCDQHFGRFIHHVPNEAKVDSTRSPASCSSCSDCSGDSGRSIEIETTPVARSGTREMAIAMFGTVSSNWS